MKIFIGILSLFFLSGCYQASLAPMIGPAATASQGNLAYSAATTGLSYGVKHKTGKFPVEHFIQSKKQKIVKKIDAIETFVEDKSNLIRTNIIDQKNNLQSILSRSLGQFSIEKKWRNYFYYILGNLNKTIVSYHQTLLSYDLVSENVIFKSS